MSEQNIYQGHLDPQTDRETDGEMTRGSIATGRRGDTVSIKESTNTVPDGCSKGFVKKLTKLLHRVSKKQGTKEHLKREVQEYQELSVGKTNKIDSEADFRESYVRNTIDDLEDDREDVGDNRADNLQTQDDSFSYDFSHTTRGVAVLIVYTKFSDGNSDRGYAEHDIKHMKLMFTSLGFNVILLKNLPVKELMDRLNDIRESLNSNCDCFACLMSSHGVEALLPGKRRVHYLYTTSGTVATADIVRKFDNDNCQKLNGKPKLFFIQACRSKFRADPGTDSDRGVNVLVHNQTDQHPTYECQGLMLPNHRDDISGLQKANDETSCCDTKACDLDKIQNTCNAANQSNLNFQNDDLENSKPNPQDTDESRADVKHSSDYRIGTKTRDRLSLDSFPFADEDSNENDSENQIALQKDHDNTRDQKLTTAVHQTEEVHMRLKTIKQFQKLEELKMNRQQRQGAQHQLPDKCPNEVAKIEDVEFFDVPCGVDCLVMFSSVSEKTAWSEDYTGGWLPYCLYRVIHALDRNEFHIDLLEVLTEVSGKMALELETKFTDKTNIYHRNKSVACIYHKLTKDIFLTKKPLILSFPPTAV